MPKGGTSGSGSYNQLAHFKAEILNKFVADHEVQTVIEFGFGDGNQLMLARYPQYTGFEVSQVAVDLCRQKFADDASQQLLWDDWELPSLIDWLSSTAEHELSHLFRRT